ncbi:MAG: response regulator [Anaerolineae bacterium]|mgnify:CR=1 FL=1|nr:response regulator [Anaerolineae bacterium]
MITRLLLIDANISFIVTLKQALESTGQFRVNLAANGQAAQEALLHSHYHAALLDCDLADIGSQALVDVIRQIRPGLPVIMMSDDMEQLERAQAEDVQGLLAKPFTARELIASLRDLVGGAEGPVIAPPDGVVRDEFVPPEMPSVVQGQTGASSPVEPDEESPPSAPERRPTELFSAEERAQIQQGLHDLDELGGPGDALAGEEAESSPLQGDELLTEFEVFERIQTGQLGRLQDDQSSDWETISPLAESFPADEESPVADLLSWDAEEQSGATSALAWPEEAPTTRALDAAEVLPWDAEEQSGATSALAWPEETPATRQLDSVEEPPETRLLDDGEEPEETRRLADTDSLGTLLETRPWSGRSAQPEHAGSPDLDDLREFLATDYSAHDADEFDDVLDAVARSSPEEYERSPDDRAFHDLVESLHPRDAAQQRRTRLDELLASIAADSGEPEQPADSGAAIDYVLDAIRRAGPPIQEGEAPDEAALDDTTIGDVIEGLFEPSFEGVLAALAGEDVGDEDYDEPSYSRLSAVPGATEQMASEETFDDSSPAWLTNYEREASALPDDAAGPALGESVELFDEPPTTPQDSRHYPATAALAAVASAEDGDDFSLTQLLEQIEGQLPPLQVDRPRLKPLPSWDSDAGLGDVRDLETIFDEMEGAEGGEPQPSLEDTRPTFSPDAYTDAATLDLDAIFGAPEPASAGEFGEEVFPDELRDLADAAHLVADASVSEASVAELFYAGVRQDSWDFAEPSDAKPSDAEPADFEFAEIPQWPEPVDSFASAPPEESLPEMAPPEPDWEEIGASEEQPAVMLSPEPDWEQPVAAPPLAPPAPTFAAGERSAAPDAPERAAAVPEPDEDAADADIAQAALRLTQYSLESSAQATLLSRPGRLLASAGDLPAAAIARLLSAVDAAWRTSPAASDALIRFVALPDAGEFLLYSTRVEADMTLSMVFGTNTPLRTIRRQARRLGESLNLMAELPAADAEAPAARTRPRRPEGLAAEPVAAAVEAEAAVPAQDAAPQTDEGPYTGYTCLWVPHDPRLELRSEFADSLREWIVDAAEADRWRVLALDVQTDYVLVSLDVPQKTHPDAAIARLMAATAQRSADEFPDLAFGQPLWADGYYFAAPPRDLSDREIVRFLAFQRQA